MATDDLTALAHTARIDVLFAGYAAERVAGTVTLIRDGERVIVVDPGMVPSRAAILGPLEELGVSPRDVTDVVLSHHHPDHTVNIALFGEIPVHDFQAVYHCDSWEARTADGVYLAPSVRLLATPGHTDQDLSVLVGTPDQVVVITHLWWTAQGPLEDPYAPDPGALRVQRERVLALADLVVPGQATPSPPAPARPARRTPVAHDPDYRPRSRSPILMMFPSVEPWPPTGGQPYGTLCPVTPRPCERPLT